MARFFNDELEICPKCREIIFFEQPIYAYKKTTNSDAKEADESMLVGIRIVCSNCGAILKTINKETQDTLLVNNSVDENYLTKKYNIK